MGIQLIRRSPSGKVNMRLHLLLGVTLLMHSLEVKGGGGVDEVIKPIKDEEKTCKAFGNECKDTSECCKEKEGRDRRVEGKVICGSHWDDQPRKICLIKPARCIPVGEEECTNIKTCCDGAQCGDGSGKDPNKCDGPICTDEEQIFTCNKPEK